MPCVQQSGGELEAHAAGTDPADPGAVLGDIRHSSTSILEDGIRCMGTLALPTL
ncbi:hypothetical protein ACIQ6K_15945 [Streptomyces sp. NPDC096354]|uniref:hypothetical protein n=1 Tax=Streptomyces sp. NPDC096354 TaxID=3366088 RepID=UPI00380D5E2F